ncbi:unnamed protein product [Protopolystoma xenopodis]|uniref:Uncharacterized protein n=1 Tax=Protopolystoma xenopodis TaxID=117903 RepID=A0A448XE19_9PLAT|nr:unnamed protein product [Protopolystoma xenopodis]
MSPSELFSLWRQSFGELRSFCWLSLNEFFFLWRQSFGELRSFCW